MEETYLTLNCEDPWFSLLEKGEKPVEGRKGKKKFRELQPGDRLLFHCVGQDRQFLAIVEKVDYFKTIPDYLQGVGLSNALPGITSLDEALKIYYQWSTPEEIEELGFLGIWIKPLK